MDGSRSRYVLFSRLALAAIVACLMVSHGRSAQASDPSRQVTIDVERCELPLVRDGITYRVAEHRYPKLKSATLAQVSVLGRHLVHPQGTSSPAEYTYSKVSTGIFVRDGAVATVCGPWMAVDPSGAFDEIIFIMPRPFRVDTASDLDRQDPWF
jgi:hypothetical protein